MNSATTALPTISAFLHAGSTITWTGTAYLLGQTSVQPLYGRISDIYGRKPIIMTSMLCIVAGGLLCGYAQTPAWLYVSRVLSGIGGGGVSSLVPIIISDLVSLKERGKYQGMISMAIGTGAMSGPFVASGLLQTGAEGWRWVFFVPSAIAAMCSVLLLILLPVKPLAGNWKEKLRKIDWLGIGASIAGIVFLLVPISSGGSIWPWNSAPSVCMLVAGGVCLSAFVYIEGNVAKLPITPIHLFRQYSAILLVQGILHDFVWQTTLYFLPLYFQDVRGYSPLQSAYLILPFLLGQSLAGAFSGPLMSIYCRYNPILRSGLLLWTIGTGLNLIFSTTTPMITYIIVLAIQGVGVGFVHQPGLVALQALSKKEDRAVATSTRNLLRALGGAAGVAISTATQHSTVKTALRHIGVLQAGQVGLRTFEKDILDAQMKGFRVVFAPLVPLMALCLLGSLLIPDTCLKEDGKETRESEEGIAQSIGPRP